MSLCYYFLSYVINISLIGFVIKTTIISPPRHFLSMKPKQEQYNEFNIPHKYILTNILYLYWRMTTRHIFLMTLSPHDTNFCRGQQFLFLPSFINHCSTLYVNMIVWSQIIIATTIIPCSDGIETKFIYTVFVIYCYHNSPINDIM